ncbi:PBAN-type neuropeptides-like isoform X1 [Pseudomyrmex gracilis]|uniref:PBAN-type neuropeptides-like isoform X1 n=1 Tax=Pseudomyrmex gracilis TaxID=219809 RepID=UPI000994BE8E|nr:PBAN-type neuropeptides-like isoform X1 [Pseudomyrmex gracilis]
MIVVTDNLANRATTFCVLTLLLCLASQASGEYESRENDGRSPENNLVSCEGKCEKRTEVGGMWFGPRLGRRRRSDPKQETSSDIMALANVLKDTRMAVVMIPGKEETPGCSRSDSRVSKIDTPEKRRKNFHPTPRTGRELNEDLFSYEDAAIDERNEIIEDEPPTFSPRLGRRLPWTPSPRLGRQLYNAFRKM